MNPVINGIGSVTFLVSPSAPRVVLRRLSSSPWPPQGGSTPDPRVEAAMDAANASYVPMDELQKVVRVMRKLEPKAPHDVLLVLDATTGQNALNQVEVFADVCDVSGLAMTKLDGTARGGVLVAVARRHGMPIHFVGIGETAEDLQPFDAHAFARALAGLDGER